MPKPTYQIVSLSETTNFLPINISATTANTANLIHTVDSTNYDELWLKAYNYTENDAWLSLALGGTATHQIVTIPVPAEVGVIPIINGETFTGGVLIKAYASASNTISLLGRVNRIVFI